MDIQDYKCNNAQQLVFEIGRCNNLVVTLWFDAKHFLGMLKLVLGI